MHRVGKNQRGQVTIFIIIGILIVAAVGIYFLVRSNVSTTSIPSEFENVYNEFVLCLEENVILGVKVLESQGGYIRLPEFESGSEYMPFSSQLNFLGNPVPYWYYVSGNNIEGEQVPSRSFMENELEEFIDSKVAGCIPENLDENYELTADVQNSETTASIKQNEIQLNVNVDLNLRKGDSSTLVRNHRIIVDSELGNLYDNALEVYNTEQKHLFLENYSVDVLRLYAPVDGVEITCAPKVWYADEVFADLEDAIQDNINSLKSSGSSDDYFVVNSVEEVVSEDVYVKFMNSKNWPKTFEVNPSEGPVLLASPVGNQEGLGVIGFCYVPYHFIYDVKFPVMVQVYSEINDEFFQFPLAVIIENNVARVSKSGTGGSYNSSQICENKNTEFSVRTYDRDSNFVDSEIYFDCFGESCYLGSTEDGEFSGMVPQCVNGHFTTKSEGFKDSENTISTVNSGSINIILEEEHELDVVLRVDSFDYGGDALVVFESSDGSSETLVYSSQETVKLSEGNYDVTVYVYENSNLVLGESVQQYCTEVPRTLGGLFGLTKEECFDVQVPEQLVSRALSGGGSSSIYFSESALNNNNRILINAERLPEPDSLNQIQENYVLFEDKNLEVLLG